LYIEVEEIMLDDTDFDRFDDWLGFNLQFDHTWRTNDTIELEFNLYDQSTLSTSPIRISQKEYTLFVGPRTHDSSGGRDVIFNSFTGASGPSSPTEVALQLVITYPDGSTEYVWYPSQYDSYSLSPTDSDRDGIIDIYDAFPSDLTEHTDTDGDGVGDNADSDDDDDGWSDSDEYIYGTDPLDDTDIPADSDGDGMGDYSDAFPNNSDEWLDTDADGVGDNSDAFPYNADEFVDSDGDGVGDNAQHAAEQKAAAVAENDDSNTSVFIIIGGIIVIALGAVMFTMRKKSNPLTKSESSFNQTMMSEPSVPMGQHMPLPIPATQPTVVNQWTDEAGHTWRSMDDGTTLWWNGADWQQA
jgi:hypothetical protein